MMKWDDSETKAIWVKEARKWLEIPDFGSLEPGTGVFVFADDGRIVKYVGISETGDHPAKSISMALAMGKAGDSFSVLFLYTESEESARGLRDFLVRKYDPPNNKGVKPFEPRARNHKIG